MPFHQTVASEALVRCGRTCCICRRYCGTAIQLHHIVAEADGGPDDLDNCIPLCLLCHEEVGSYNPDHPIGRKFTPKELRSHRDIWFEFVKAHPERIGNSPDTLFKPTSIPTTATPEFKATVEPIWHENNIWSKERGHERKEVFAAKVRNQGTRPIYVDVIGFTAGSKRYPGLFSPWSSKDTEEAAEVASGHPQIFSFFGVNLDIEDIPKLDGMYLVTGAGDLFDSRPLGLQRLINEFVAESG